MSTKFYKTFSPAIYPMFRSVWVFMQISTYNYIMHHMSMLTNNCKKTCNRFFACLDVSNQLSDFHDNI